MLLQDLHEQLSTIELSNLSIGTKGAGTIPAAKHPTIRILADQALTAIYSRFSLLEKELSIEADDTTYIYYLLKKHAHQDPTAAQKYIRDTADDPFTEDVLKVLHVYNEEGQQLVLNDPLNSESLFTPKFNAIQIPGPVSGNAYTVLYQADHPTLVPDDLNQQIDLPSYLEPALRAHVASRIFSAMNGQEHQLQGQTLMAEFNRIVGIVEEKDLASTSQAVTAPKFNDRGFI